VPTDDTPRIVQQIDLPHAPVTIAEHRSHRAYCPRCQKTHFAPLPAVIDNGGLLGPRLTTLIAYLKGVCHASFSTIRLFLRDVVGVTLSRGQLAKTIAKVSEALQQPYEELLARLPNEATLNVDETSHSNNAQTMWTWCFRASLFTLFAIDPTRSSDVLLRVLGEEFDGVLGCDHFSAYRKYMRVCDVRLQFCLAHLIREVRYLTTLPALEDVVYGTRLLMALEQLFGVIHRRETLGVEEFEQQLQAARDQVLAAGVEEAGTANSQRMAKRMRKYGKEYFTFVTTPGVEATNNLAEQAIRFVVIDRLITQGTRSETGQRWSERMWTVMATCVQQGRSVWEFLSQAVSGYLGGEAGPSLVPQSS
jgi:transposase